MLLLLALFVYLQTNQPAVTAKLKKLQTACRQQRLITNKNHNIMEKRLFLNTLTFDYPKEPVKFYFSATNDAARKSTKLMSPVLFPEELK